MSPGRSVLGRPARRGRGRALRLLLGGVAHALLFAVWGYVIVIMNDEPAREAPVVESIAAPASASLV